MMGCGCFAKSVRPVLDEKKEGIERPVEEPTTRPRSDSSEPDLATLLVRVGELRSQLEAGYLFCDKEFPANVNSIFYNASNIANMAEAKEVVWKRAKDIVKSPVLFETSLMFKDKPVQGQLGDCWFISACTSISEYPELINRTIPLDQFLYNKNYFGLVYCFFWQFGKWEPVIIDDFLPTKESRLLFSQNLEPRVLWTAFLEKAYAKLNGCYEALKGGNAANALVDLTGGLAEIYKISDYQNDKKWTLFSHMKSAFDSGSALLTCSAHDLHKSNETVDKNGLVLNHAYSIIGVYEVALKKPAVQSSSAMAQLLKIRNPWTKTEWLGKFSDRDPIWKSAIDRDTANTIGFRSKAGDDDDGEFFIEYDDFCQSFKHLIMCTIGDSTENFKLVRGVWIGNESAGGSRNDIDSFAKNPQYLIYVSSKRSGDKDQKSPTEQTESHNLTESIIVALMQDYRRSERNTFQIKLFQIGFIVYRFDRQDYGNKPSRVKRLDAEFFGSHREYEKADFINYREVIKRFEIEDQCFYVIVPCTFNPNETSAFVLRMFCKSHLRIRQL